ncbi:MAG TPA: hypothetical protein VGD17_10095 [Chitinophagaceae bacterium]
MSLWLFFPVVSALMGWLLVEATLWLAFRKFLPARKAAIADRLSKQLIAEILPQGELEEKLSNPESFQKLLPSIEEHIDEFLRHKLGRSMPYLSMFVGEKTISQLKELFMEELSIIFPVVMKKYVAGLQQENRPEDVLKARLVAIPAKRIESGIKMAFPVELRLLKLMGAGIGLVTGIMHLVFQFAVR